ncbi:alpha/beta fold hydrolase [Alkalicoccus luteus]|uniref:Alpha/beta hydrolase n=1 Tax=Alkalicoccus luteus TaxID=1237094 RepID=A0A969PV57_9BACI|nr:alpha/beta hydrolase [Alkalicoccus luteus]NJP38089.1 alpha/beta hydrolase [Alkalicoccus luteus]
MALSTYKQNHVQEYGNGPETLMLAHGFGTDQQVWQEMIPRLSESFRVITFDYTGAGQSDLSAYDPIRYSSESGYAEDIISILDERNLTDVHFVGHSVSGMIGAEAAIERPDLFKTLTMIGPSAHYLNDGTYYGGFERDEINELLTLMERNYKEWAKMLAPVAMGPSNPDQLTLEFEERLTRNNAAITRQFAEVTFQIDMRDRIQELHKPVLILQGQEDTIAPLKAVEFIHDQLSDSELVLLEATGHNPHLSAPLELAAHILRFVQAREAGITE